MRNGKAIMISGAMTGCADLNHPAFNAKAKELHEAGYIVLNPASLPLGLEHDEYMKICFSYIDICDAVYFLYGWQYSRGARLEFDYACRQGKRLIFEEKGDYSWFCKENA